MSGSVDGMLDAARRRLRDAPKQALGELQENRRTLGIPRPPRIVRRGAAWHLGVLLLTEDAVLATGDIVRAQTERRRGFSSESQRRRAELAAAAARGGFPEGETVHVGWRLIVPDALTADSAPLALRGGSPAVRWSAAGGYLPLQVYLEERVALLLDPPERA